MSKTKVDEIIKILDDNMDLIKSSTKGKWSFDKDTIFSTHENGGHTVATELDKLKISDDDLKALVESRNRLTAATIAIGGLMSLLEWTAEPSAYNAAESTVFELLTMDHLEGGNDESN